MTGRDRPSDMSVAMLAARKRVETMGGAGKNVRFYCCHSKRSSDEADSIFSIRRTS